MGVVSGHRGHILGHASTLRDTERIAEVPACPPPQSSRARSGDGIPALSERVSTGGDLSPDAKGQSAEHELRFVKAVLRQVQI